MYQFPAAKSVSNSLSRQWLCLLVAVIKIRIVLFRGDLQRAAAGTWTAKREAETLHRVLAGKGVDVKMAYDDSKEVEHV